MSPEMQKCEEVCVKRGMSRIKWVLFIRKGMKKSFEMILFSS